MLTFLGYCQKEVFPKSLAIAFICRCCIKLNWSGVDKSSKIFHAKCQMELNESLRSLKAKVCSLEIQ